MAKLWHPDTCLDGQCIIDLEKHEHIQTCGHHARVTTKGSLVEKVIETNRAKNVAVEEAAKARGVVADQVKWTLGTDDKVTIEDGARG